MKLTKLLPLAFLAISHIAPADAQERREIPDYRETGFEQNAALSAELDDFLAAYTAAWGAQDTDSFIALHHEDTEWINAYARMFQSDESLAVFLEERLFPAFAAQVSRTEVANMRRVSTRLIGDDVAVLHLYTDGNRGQSRNAGETARRTHFHLVLSRSDGMWKVEHTAIMDARN
ncbi:MAG: DUF4440 domain-containing protein [Maricaulis sp.]|uniref:nuclear transport factor 2 family protein n=1 Tax=Maricaulis sp. TaxID=1486257 RepID=UPI001B116430|nr:nuclear transport factor 2 family protein [Maricaulis sp.]MBO6728659.1 DUF4440 domain-containing protein [Maricaulis sp.]MBO6848213.1 DUF4440 domain-containing protein [Maricaulis sp.]MBO6877938.1 DUF4440 domain-containing protein [Maricaulis sp.]